jgi:cardiolipin synthase
VIPTYLQWAIPIAVVLLHVAGLACAVEAVVSARTPQGSLAWALSLVTFPYVSVPLYLVFGRSEFEGYVAAQRAAGRQGREQLTELIKDAHTFGAQVAGDRAPDLTVFEKLAILPCLGGNAARLLIDGQATFAAIFEAIRRAKSYVLVQAFIIHDDQIGGELKELLLAKRREGVRVFVLFDEIGSRALPRQWKEDLRAAGAEVFPFGATKGRGNRFQLNFRSHRKIVVVDGREAFVGGHNVGDEYLGRNPRFGHWRDTHIGVRGPAVQAVQLSFVMDWYWATRTLPEMEWRPEAADGDLALLLIPTGPADSDNHCEMMFMHAAHIARQRLWITSPYFVPSPAVFEALRLAALRGVDVRVVLPKKPDHILVYLAAFQYIPQVRQAGVRVYRYTRGFLHQKVMLIDDDVAAVGTANLDNRSLRLNFELTMWCVDAGFAAEVERMLAADLADSSLVENDELLDRGFLFRAASKVARLMDPIL